MILLALGGALGVAQNRARAKEQIDSVSRLVSPVINAPAAALDGSLNRATDMWVGFRQSTNLKAEVRRLQMQANAAALYTEQIERLEGRIQSLEQIIKLPPAPRGRIAARIVGYAPYEGRITLSVGTGDGIKPGQAVVTGVGLLAVVQTVGTGTCQANLITSPRQVVGAVAVTDTGTALGSRVLGLVKGETETTLTLETTNVVGDVAGGAKVFTNGLSSTIPGGIYIGFVLEQQATAELGQRKIKVLVKATLDDAREVYVLK